MMTMFKQHTAAVAFLTALGLSHGAPAQAAEQLLEFKLVTMPVDVKNLEVANVEGQNVTLMKARGVAYLKDGRVAAKDFVYSADFNKGSGPFFGYSTYHFDDGSSITARFAGTLRPGQPMHGDYTILSGTGAFAAAKGTGSFDAVAHKLVGANLFNAKLAIVTP